MTEIEKFRTEIFKLLRKEKYKEAWMYMHAYRFESRKCDRFRKAYNDLKKTMETYPVIVMPQDQAFIEWLKVVEESETEVSH